MYARPESGELDPESPGYQFNTDFSVNYWLQLGAKRETVRKLWPPSRLEKVKSFKNFSDPGFF